MPTQLEFSKGVVGHILRYHIEVRRLSEEDGGGFVASIPDLPGCSGDGPTQAEAIVDLESSFAAWVDAAKALRRSIPEPNSQTKHSVVTDPPSPL